MIASVVERRNPAQLLLILRPYDEAILCPKFLPKLLRNIFVHHLLRGSDAVLSVDDPEVARSHVFKRLRLRVQLRHHTKRLLLRLVRHVDHELLDLLLALVLKCTDRLVFRCLE